MPTVPNDEVQPPEADANTMIAAGILYDQQQQRAQMALPEVEVKPPPPELKGTVGQAIQEAADVAGVDRHTMGAIASIESSWNPQSNRNRQTQYKGLFQLGREEWATYGQGDIYNARDNAMATARMFLAHKENFNNLYGRDPSDRELYMIHQQGLGFFTRGAMTNIAGNPYPGMSGPQSHDSFMEGWGRELDRRKARLLGTQFTSGTEESRAGPVKRASDIEGGQMAMGDYPKRIRGESRPEPTFGETEEVPVWQPRKLDVPELRKRRAHSA
jgi:hypothetical protein